MSLFKHFYYVSPQVSTYEVHHVSISRLWMQPKKIRIKETRVLRCSPPSVSPSQLLSVSVQSEGHKIL